jgi:hypothetical protein
LGLGLDLSAGAALAHYADWEISEAVIRPVDVGQHAHGRMVLLAGAAVHAVPGKRWYWMRTCSKLGAVLSGAIYLG